MKTRTIKFSIDEKTGRIGFMIEQPTGSSENVLEILELVGILEHLKQLQLEKLKIKGKKTFKDTKF